MSTAQYDGLASEPSKIGQIQNQLDTLERTISYQGELLTQLCQETAPFCREEQDNVEDRSHDDIAECQLARVVRIKREKLEDYNERIKDLIARIEL